MAGKSSVILFCLFIFSITIKSVSLVAIRGYEDKFIISNSSSNKPGTNQCKDIKSVNKKCSACMKSEILNDLNQFQQTYDNHKYKSEIIQQLEGKYNKYSCYSAADQHDFQDGCSISDPCPNSVISIFPPSTEMEWCYFEIIAQRGQFENENNTLRPIEDVIYLRGDRMTCSKNNKWTLATKDEDRMKNFFKYRLTRNNWKKGIFYS